MTIKEVSYVLLVMPLFAGCSGAFGTMDGIMQSWEGSHIDKVISQWGYPSGERQVASHRLLIWTKNQQVRFPSQTQLTGSTYGNTFYGTATTYGGGMVAASCDRILEIDDRGYVTRWQWEGNNCPFAEWFQYANWRKRDTQEAR